MEAIVNDIKSKITDFSGKVDYLIDMSDIGHSSLSARVAAVSNLHDLRIRRQALFGGSPFTRHMLNLMIHGIKKAGIIKHFESREEALVWLGIKL